MAWDEWICMCERVYEMWMMNLDNSWYETKHEMVGYENDIVLIWNKILYSWIEYDELGMDLIWDMEWFMGKKWWILTWY